MDKQIIDLKTKSILELKAIAYDLIATKEQTQRNLDLVNTELSERFKNTPELPEIKSEVVEAEKVDEKSA